MAVVEGSDYSISRRGTLLGQLTVTEVDFPWITCDFSPEPSFSAVQEAFADFSTSAKYLGTEQQQQWEQARLRVLNLGLVMEPVAAQEDVAYPDILLYVEGSKARFRFSGSPNARCKSKRLPLLLLPLWRKVALALWQS